jgi:hypothetical protein
MYIKLFLLCSQVLESFGYIIPFNIGTSISQRQVLIGLPLQKLNDVKHINSATKNEFEKDLVNFNITHQTSSDHCIV